MSKMKKCDTCGAEIAESAKRCPACGAKNKKPIYKRVWFWGCAWRRWRQHGQWWKHKYESCRWGNVREDDERGAA